MADSPVHRINSSAVLSTMAVSESVTEAKDMFVRLVSGESRLEPVAEGADTGCPGEDQEGEFSRQPTPGGVVAKEMLAPLALSGRDKTAWTTMGLFLGYAYYNTLRGAFPIQMRRVAQDLNIPVSQIGLPNSVFSAAYGVGKFFGSILTDYLPCAEFHTLGILLCGMDVAAVGLCRGIASITSVWGLQGALQAFGWPFLSRVLLDRLPKEQCAKYWGILSMAGNVGAMAAPYGAVAATHLGMSWRKTLSSFGVSSALVALLVHLMLRRGGASRSSKAVVATKEKNDEKQVTDSSKAAKVTFRVAMLAILRNPALLALFLCNSLSFGSSKCTKEWGSMYLRGTGLAVTEMQSATLLFWAEIGGSLGAALSGIISSSLGGRHALTCLLSALLGLSSTSVLALRAFAWKGQGSSPLPFGLACALQACSLAGINGVRTLSGLHLADVVRHQGLQLGLANGFAELIGQVGSVLSGLPVGAAVDRAAAAAAAAGLSGDHAGRVGWAAVPGILALGCGGMSVLNLALLPYEGRRLGAPLCKQRQAAEDGEPTDKLKGA